MEEIIEINGVKYQKVESETKRESIEEYIKKHPIRYGIEPITIEGFYIKIELPFANKNWTFLVWKWVEDFIKEFPQAYPVHRSNHTFNFQYIDIGFLNFDE